MDITRAPTKKTTLLCEINHLGKGKDENDEGEIFAEIIRQMPMGVIVLDKEGQVCWHNPAAEELLNIPLWQCAWQDCLQQLKYQPQKNPEKIILKNGQTIQLRSFQIDEYQQTIILLLR